MIHLTEADRAFLVAVLIIVTVVAAIGTIGSFLTWRKR